MDLGTISSWIAAAISAGATGTTYFLRRRDRPEPAWFLEAGKVDLPDRFLARLQQTRRDRIPHATIRLINVGDGDAFAVRLVGNNLDLVVWREPGHGSDGGFETVIPRLAAGESVWVLAWNIPFTLPTEQKIGMSWISSPTRHGRRGKAAYPVESIDGYPTGTLGQATI